jgi:hypothetical protein
MKCALIKKSRVGAVFGPCGLIVYNGKNQEEKRFLSAHFRVHGPSKMSESVVLAGRTPAYRR